jgi:hypothetical protein
MLIFKKFPSQKQNAVLLSLACLSIFTNIGCGRIAILDIVENKDGKVDIAISYAKENNPLTEESHFRNLGISIPNLQWEEGGYAVGTLKHFTLPSIKQTKNFGISIEKNGSRKYIVSLNKRKLNQFLTEMGEVTEDRISESKSKMPFDGKPIYVINISFPGITSSSKAIPKQNINGLGSGIIKREPEPKSFTPFLSYLKGVGDYIVIVSIEEDYFKTENSKDYTFEVKL